MGTGRGCSGLIARVCGMVRNLGGPLRHCCSCPSTTDAFSTAQIGNLAKPEVSSANQPLQRILATTVPRTFLPSQHQSVAEISTVGSLQLCPTH
eukprot:1800803-Amphidinium_carterae.1